MGQPLVEGAVVSLVGSHSLMDKVMETELEGWCWEWERLFWNLDNFVYPILPVTFGGETVGPFYLVSTPEEVHKIYHTGGECVTCCGLISSCIGEEIGAKLMYHHMIIDQPMCRHQWFPNDLFGM